MRKFLFPSLFVIQLFYCSTVLFSFAQSSKLDSLNTLFRTATHDTTRAAMLVALTEELAASNPDTVIPMCMQALAIIEKNIDKANEQEKHAYLKIKADALNNIGCIYDDQGQIKKALDYYGRSLKIREEIGDKKGIAYSLYNIGVSYEKEGQIKEALDYYRRSLKIREEIVDKKGIAYSLEGIGWVYLKQKNYSKAERFAIRSLQTAKEGGYVENLRDAEELFSDIYKKTKKHEQALEHYELFIVYRDSIKNKENEKAAVRQQVKYEFEKAMLVKEQEEKEAKRRESEVLSRRNNLQYSAVVIGLFFLFGLVFFLGKIPLPEWVVELSTFVPFMILFEFTLVLIDPYIETYAGGDPAYKLLINAACAVIMYPIHSFFEKKLKERVNKIKKEKEKKYEEEFRKESEKFISK